jgi:hypothetical protein
MFGVVASIVLAGNVCPAFAVLILSSPDSSSMSELTTGVED